MSALQESEDERDRGLVERHQAGDDEAFAQLYARHHERLVRYCRRLVMDPHVAEDLAQEAFVRAYQAMPRLGGPRRFYPWLTVIARRVVIDHIRRANVARPTPDLAGEPAGAPDDVVLRQMDNDHVSQALSRLGPRHREALRLRDWEELSYDAIADRLGVAPTTVPPLLHRARAALRREYLMVLHRRDTILVQLSALGDLLRRTRERVSTWAAWLPDPGVIAGQMAGAVIGLSALLGMLPQPASLAGAASGGSDSSSMPSPEAGELGTSSSTAVSHAHPPPERRRPAPGPSNPLAPAILENTVPQEDIRAGGRTIVGLDPENNERQRERTRHMPYQYEFAGNRFSADPGAAERDLRRWPPVVPEEWGWPPCAPCIMRLTDVEWGPVDRAREGLGVPANGSDSPAAP